MHLGRKCSYILVADILRMEDIADKEMCHLFSV